MSISADEVRAIAHLARVAIDEGAIPVYAEQLSRILAFVEQMELADTAEVEPLAHPLDLKAPMRDDVVNETNDRLRFQALAPRVEDGLYLVPRVID